MELKPSGTWISERTDRVFGRYGFVVELILPTYSLVLVTIYYQPRTLLAIEDLLSGGILTWILWTIGAALAGVLALSALLLAFSLLYAPFYLLTNAARILRPQVWIDRRELRFYVGCCALLLGLVTLAVLNIDAALASFLLLAGFSSFLWRVLA